MATQNTTLLAALEELERALAADAHGNTAEQSARLKRSLDTLEGAVRREAEMLQTTHGRIVNINRPRIPSPTMERRAMHLREELEKVQKEIQGLRTKLRGAAAPSGLRADPSNLAGALPVAPEAGALPDCGVLFQRARRLAQALEHIEDEEADLIFDSVNTDIGSPD